MTFEKQICKRCSAIQFCVLVGLDFYCKACFDAVTNNEQKADIDKIMQKCGIVDLEWKWKLAHTLEQITIVESVE